MLVGLPGSGKTTFGKRLADRYKLKFLDTDQLLEEQFGCSISQFFLREGEGEFRLAEHKLVKELLQNSNRQFVLATGGGTPCYHNSLGLIKEYASSIYLEISWTELERRLRANSGSRPLLNEMPTDSAEEFLKEKFGWRLPFYQEADLTIDAARPDFSLSSLERLT